MKDEPLTGNHAEEIKSENAAIHKIENNFEEKRPGDYYILQDTEIEWLIEKGEAESIIEFLDMQEIIDEETYKMIADFYDKQEVQIALLDLQRKYGKR